MSVSTCIWRSSIRPVHQDACRLTSHLPLTGILSDCLTIFTTLLPLCPCSDLKLRLEHAERARDLAQARGDRFEKQATQLTQKYKSVDLDTYQSMERSCKLLEEQVQQYEVQLAQQKQQLEETSKAAQEVQQLRVRYSAGPYSGPGVCVSC